MKTPPSLTIFEKGKFLKSFLGSLCLRSIARLTKWGNLTSLPTDANEIYNLKNISQIRQTEKESKTSYHIQDQDKRRKTLSRYNSVAHVEIIVIWHLSSFVRLSSFRSKKVLKASCKWAW